MYECRVQSGFSAAHQLRLIDGSLEPLHRHDWKVVAVFRGPVLDTVGLLIDFVAAERALNEVTTVLNDGNLNGCPMLRGANPSAEHVAGAIFAELRAKLGADAPLVAVYVEEAPGCIAGYLEEDAT
jgi:6-pyruvoyltetrahydropterin/6-carboxytetrahydropterin synthase